MSDLKHPRPPVETTEALGTPPVAPQTHGIEIWPGRIFIVGAGVIDTTAYRKLEPWEFSN